MEKLFRASLAGLNTGDLAAATVACNTLRSAAPDDPAVLQLHATIELRAGRSAEARVSIDRCLARRPGHVPSLILAARAAASPHDAIAPLRKAISRDPAAAEPAFLLCRILLELRDPGLGDALRHAASHHAAAGQEWQDLGFALQRAGLRRDALDALDRAAAAQPSLGRIQLARGLLLRESDQMAEARTALEHAVMLDETASSAWFALGLTCQDLLDEPAAAFAFEAALRHGPELAEAAVNLGIARQRLGDMDAAIAAYRNAMRIRPDTLGRIAQAMTTASTGMLCLKIDRLRRLLVP